MDIFYGNYQSSCENGGIDKCPNDKLPKLQWEDALVRLTEETDRLRLFNSSLNDSQLCFR